MPNQPTKFRTKHWVEINDAGGTYNTNSETKFKTSKLKSSLSGTISVPNTGKTTNPNNTQNITIKNCTPFPDYKSEINNRQIDNAKDIDTVMPMYKLIEYRDNYIKTSGRLRQYHRDEPFLDTNGTTADFPANNSTPFKFKTNIADRTENDGTKDIKIVTNKIFNFWRTLETPLSH